MEVVGGMNVKQSQGIVCMSRDVGALPECEVIHQQHPITPPSSCTDLGRVEPELVGLPGRP